MLKVLGGLGVWCCSACRWWRMRRGSGLDCRKQMRWHWWRGCVGRCGASRRGHIELLDVVLVVVVVVVVVVVGCRRA